MVHYAIITNPFNASETTEKFESLSGESIGAWLAKNQDKYDHLKSNLICVFQGEEVEPQDLFKIVPQDDDIVVISPRVSGAVAWVIVAVAVAVATYLAFSLFQPNIPNQSQAASVYSVQGKSNQNKLGSPIERCYGKVRMYPAYAASPYNQIINNDQYQFQLFCLGHGTIDKTTCSVFVEDTDILNLEEVTYEIYNPGEAVTLFADNVNTIPEVSNIELEEIEISGGAWSGPFSLCGSGEVIFKVEYDISLPQGLYRVHDEDGEFPNWIELQAQIRQIDDSGNPLGGWVMITNEYIERKEVDPIRFTKSYPVTEGRYEIQVRRNDGKFQGETTSRYINETYWVQARGFRPSTQNYGDKSLLAVRAKATNNFNDQSSRKINVIGTWKTPVWDGNAWTLQTNRSIVWAFVDVYRAQYGGKVTDEYLNLCELMNIDVELYSQGKTFDWIFDQRMPAWEAAKIIARVARATPIPQGIKVSMKIDKDQSVMNQMFTPRNIVKGTLQRQVSLAKPEANDGILIEYVDPVSFLPEQVLCLVDSDQGNKPKKVILAGCTNRDFAYREGLYIRATEKKQRENLSFDTGLEGRPSKYGDLIGVQHDNLIWGQSGYVKEINGDTITLSQDVTFAAGINRILLKDSRGGGQIFEVTAGSAPNEVVTTTPLVNDYPDNEYVEPQAYSFGEIEKEVRFWKVVQIKPMGGDKVRLVNVNYDESIYQYDSAIAPPLDKGSLPPPIPNKPVIEGLSARTSKFNVALATVSWQPALGANSYILQKSLDGVNWEPEISLEYSNYNFTTAPNTQTWIRVLGVGASRGDFVVWTGVLGVATLSPSNPKNFRLLNAFNSNRVETIWDASSLAESYQVTTYALPADTQVFQDDVTQVGYSFTSSDVASVLPPVRDYRMELVAKNGFGTSADPKILIIHNDPPAVPSNISLVVLSESENDITIQISWDNVLDEDFKTYRVWESDTQGFTPDASTLAYEAVNSQYIFVLPKVGGNPQNYYFRLAALDVWGDDDANISPEFSAQDFGDQFEVNTGGDLFSVDTNDNIFQP